jgi:hypothetical protein
MKQTTKTMKGILQKIENAWVVKWNSPLEYREPIHELKLHPEDELYCLQSYDGLEVEFKIQKVFLSDKTLWYAKLIPTKQNEEYENMDKNKKVTRIEVIDKQGRQYVKWNCSIELSYQDDDRTLKIFVNK